METKTQILMIHGGETFKNREDYLKYLKTRDISFIKSEKWSDSYLTKKLGKDFEISRPRFPLPENARYEDWKIHFEKFLPYLKGKYILCGNSLGGIFLAQYLSENKLPKKALSVYLICPPFDGSLTGEDLVGGFKLSKDDDCVPVAHAEKYRAKLKKAEIIIYESKNGHFRITEFPEIVKMIKGDVK